MRSFSAESSQGGNAEEEEKKIQKMSEGTMPQNAKRSQCCIKPKGTKQ
jgi:hypothetical protein